MKLPPTLLLLCLAMPMAAAFLPASSTTTRIHGIISQPQQKQKQQQHTASTSTTALNVLLDTPDGFFTVTMFGSGLILSFAKSFGRLRMEERAWEQRLEAGRTRRLEADPTLTELDLRRKEAAMEWSAYGKPRMEEEEANYQRRVQELDAEDRESRSSSGKRVRTMERETEQEEEEDDDRDNRMTDSEIDQFEREFGIDYDPYYDDPYSQDELPLGEFQSDKRHGDRFYEDGEVFYKDADSGLYYRQGAKPRTVSFF